jgi:hypothetical protein
VGDDARWNGNEISSAEASKERSVGEDMWIKKTKKKQERRGKKEDRNKKDHRPPCHHHMGKKFAGIRRSPGYILVCNPRRYLAPCSRVPPLLHTPFQVPLLTSVPVNSASREGERNGIKLLKKNRRNFLTLTPFGSVVLFLFPAIQYHGLIIMMVGHKTEIGAWITVL